MYLDDYKKSTFLRCFLLYLNLTGCSSNACDALFPSGAHGAYDACAYARVHGVCACGATCVGPADKRGRSVDLALLPWLL